MKYGKEIVLAIVISYSSLAINAILNDNESPMSLFLMTLTIVSLITALILLVKSMNKDRKGKDATD